MNVWSNFGEKSAAEHAEILSVEANFTSGQHSRPIIAMKQDAMTGGYLLTFGDVVIDKATFFDCIALEHFDFDIMEKYDHILEVYRWKGIYKKEEQKLQQEIKSLFEKAAELVKKNKKYIEEFNSLKTSSKKEDRLRRDTIKRINESIKLKHKDIKDDIEYKKQNFDVIVEERLMFSGRSLFSYLLPNNFEYTFKNDMSLDGNPVHITRGVMLTGTLDKKVLGSSAGSISHQIFLQYSARKAIEFVSYYQMIINRWLLTRGLSVGIEDCVPKLMAENEKSEIVPMKDVDRIEEHRRKGSRIIEFTKKSYMCVERNNTKTTNPIKQESARCFSNALLTIQTEEDEELLEIKINNALNNARDICQKLAKDALEPTNSFVSIIRSGAKGNDNNITQITSMLGQQNMGGMRMQLTFGGRTLPHFKKDWEYEAKTSEMSSESIEKMFQSRGFVSSSFYKGLSPSEFFFHAVGGREGVIDTAIRTANTGYTQRKMIKMMEDLRVNYLGVVESSNNNKIISFDYGGDNYDGSKVIYKNGKPTFVDVESLCNRLNADYEWVAHNTKISEVKDDEEEIKKEVEEKTKEDVEKDNNEDDLPINMKRAKKAVQNHGFDWEKNILRNIYKLTDDEINSIGYTAKYDLPSEMNKIDNKNISIKTTSNKNMICMADCLRFYDSVKNDSFNCVIIFYRQDENDKHIEKVYEIDLTGSLNVLFGDIKREELEKLDNLVKSVPQKRKPTDEEYKGMYEYRDSLQKRSGFAHIDIKCNSQQSRLQCSLSKFQKFIKENKDRVVEESDDSLKGTKILEKVYSSKRVFSKK